MARRKGLTRLASLYGMVEQMRSLELRVAASAVDDVVLVASIEAAIRQSKIFGARAALAAGDREEWQMAETTREGVEARIERLANLRVERETRREEAALAHSTSRVEMEQLDRVVEQQRDRLALEEARRAQAESDDRYAARLAWAQRIQLRSRE